MTKKDADIIPTLSPQKCLRGLWSQIALSQFVPKLPHMNYQELVTLWAQIKWGNAPFGTYCYTKRKDFIRKRLQWRINTLVSGGLSERARKRAAEIADETLIRTKARTFNYIDETPVESTAQEIITRIYKGKLYEVYRNPDGSFTYLNQRYRTLSEVSTLIEGYFISGNPLRAAPTRSAAQTAPREVSLGLGVWSLKSRPVFNLPSNKKAQ